MNSTERRPLRAGPGAARPSTSSAPAWAGRGHTESFRRLSPANNVLRTRAPSPNASIRSTASAFPDFVDMETEAARSVRLRYKDTAKHTIWRECKLAKASLREYRPSLASAQTPASLGPSLSVPHSMDRLPPPRLSLPPPVGSLNTSDETSPAPSTASQTSTTDTRRRQRSKLVEMGTEEMRTASLDSEEPPLVTHL